MDETMDDSDTIVACRSTTGPSSSAQQSGTAPSNQAESNTIGASGKVRGSCENCAKSKVKCTREKPTCERCETRGIDCVYLMSRRPGRVPGANSRRSNPKHKTDHGKTAGTGTEQPRSSPQAVVGMNGLASSDNAPPNDEAQAFSLSPIMTVTGSETGRTRSDSAFGAAFDVFDSCRSVTSSPKTLQQNWSLGIDDVITEGSSTDVLSALDDPMYLRSMEFEDSLGAMNSWSVSGFGAIPDCNGTATIDSSRDSMILDQFLQPPTSTSSTSLNSNSVGQVASSTLPDRTAMANTTTDLFMPDANLPLPAGDRPEEIPMGTESSIPLHGFCDCVSMAWKIFNKLNRPQLRSSFLATSRGSTESVLAIIGESIESSLNLLACASCAEDRYLLMALLMISTKILARYASEVALLRVEAEGTDTAEATSDHAQTSNIQEYRRYSVSNPSNGMTEIPPTSSGSDVHRSIGGDGNNEHGCSRSVMKDVARELHRVQRLIFQISSRLNSLPCEDSGTQSDSQSSDSSREQSRTDDTPTRMATRPSPSSSKVDLISPLSKQALLLVEKDVRRSLLVFSASVRRVLKNS